MNIEKQIFDSNCNDCGYLRRSLVNRQKHVDFHYRMQKDVFDAHRIKLMKSAEKWLKKGKKDKAKNVLKEARKLKFSFDESTCSLSFGFCKLKKKEVSFIPNIFMEENFICFKHRNDEYFKNNTI